MLSLLGQEFKLVFFYVVLFVMEMKEEGQREDKAAMKEDDAVVGDCNKL